MLNLVYDPTLTSICDYGKNDSFDYRGLPGGSGGKESTCQCKRPWFDHWVGKITWRRKWQLTPIFLEWESQRIPWTEELGELQSMGLQKVRHNWATKNAFMHFYWQALKDIIDQSNQSAWESSFPTCGIPVTWDKSLFIVWEGLFACFTWSLGHPTNTYPPFSK